MRILSLTLAFLLFCSMAYADFKKVVRHSLSSVYVVVSENKKSLGTGFAAKGYIITAAHVVSGSKKAYVANKDGKIYKVKVVYRDIKKDVALLEVIEDSDFKFDTSVELGEDVIVIGNPFGYFFSISKGIVSAKRSEFIQIDARIERGSSGGPVFDEEGNVIGMVAQKRASISLIIPASTIMEVINESASH